MRTVVSQYHRNVCFYVQRPSGLCGDPAIFEDDTTKVLGHILYSLHFASVSYLYRYWKFWNHHNLIIANENTQKYFLKQSSPVWQMVSKKTVMSQLKSSITFSDTFTPTLVSTHTYGTGSMTQWDERTESMGRIYSMSRRKLSRDQYVIVMSAFTLFTIFS